MIGNIVVKFVDGTSSSISVISIVVGVMIGLLKSIEENSVVKYIVTFVFGFLAYYIIC